MVRCKMRGMTMFSNETTAAPTVEKSKRAGWRRALGIACGIGILAAIALGIGLAFAAPALIQAGILVAAAAAIVALAGGYQYFLYED